MRACSRGGRSSRRRATLVTEGVLAWTSVTPRMIGNATTRAGKAAARPKNGLTITGIPHTAPTMLTRRPVILRALRTRASWARPPPTRVSAPSPRRSSEASNVAALRRLTPVTRGNGRRGIRRSIREGSRPTAALARNHATRSSRRRESSLSPTRPGPTTNTLIGPRSRATCTRPQAKHTRTSGRTSPPQPAHAPRAAVGTGTPGVAARRTRAVLGAVSMLASASTTAAADCGRSPGALASRRPTSSRRGAGTSAGSSGIAALRWASRTASGVGPPYGGRPTTISWRMQPRAYRSVRGSTASGSRHSGAMYGGVPRTVKRTAVGVGERGRPGHAEVGDLGDEAGRAGGQQDVGRLEVAVDHAAWRGRTPTPRRSPERAAPPRRGRAVLAWRGGPPASCLRPAPSASAVWPSSSVMPNTVIRFSWRRPAASSASRTNRPRAPSSRSWRAWRIFPAYTVPSWRSTDTNHAGDRAAADLGPDREPGGRRRPGGAAENQLDCAGLLHEGGRTDRRSSGQSDATTATRRRHFDCSARAGEPPGVTAIPRGHPAAFARGESAPVRLLEPGVLQARACGHSAWTSAPRPSAWR